MGSSSTKEIGKELVDQQQETVGGFHVIEVMKGGKEEYCFKGFKIITFIILLIIILIQIHGATATYGLVSLVVISIMIYIIWRSCRRRLMKERGRNMTPTFHLPQPPSVRVPIFGRNQEPPPMYPTIPSATSDAPPQYDIEKIINSLV